MGKGKDTHSNTALEHQSRPLASLKDPDAFGPPPKNLAYHGAAAAPHVSPPERRGLGAPLTTLQTQAIDEQNRREVQAAEEADKKAAAPPVPYRADGTGLSTSRLPKPPVRRLENEDQVSTAPASPGIKPKPALPPRLPPRASPATVQDMVASPPAYSSVMQDSSQKSYINRGALARLGSAGVSVPGLGIGGGPHDANPWRDEYGSNSDGPHHTSPDAHAPQLSELQSRFSKMSSKSPSSQTQGTSLAQKQAALKTAKSFHNDPSSISLSNAKATASTANNFRERHGDQVAAGWRSAGVLSEKYDVANKVNGFTANGSVSPKTEALPTSVNTETLSHPSSAIKKAPPPPPKKPLAGSNSVTSPPPIPLYSKPKS